MKGSISAELMVLRKRASTWILLGIFATLAAFFSYVVPYLSYRASGGASQPLADLLPAHFVGTMLAAFPFYGGVFALMLGVLSLGSEYGWGTLKTLFTQRPTRLRIFAAKLVALGVGLIPFVLIAFAVGAIGSAIVAGITSSPMVWPSAWPIVRALLAGWFILAVWAAIGVLLAALSRGTALAIGIGILYALVIEGLLSAFVNEISFLRPLIREFVRANAYSLAQAFGANMSTTGGPGAFSGPFVGTDRALLVLAAYLVVCLAVAGYVLRRRDVA